MANKNNRKGLIMDVQEKTAKASTLIEALMQLGLFGEKLQRVMGFIEGITASKEYEDKHPVKQAKTV